MDLKKILSSEDIFVNFEEVRAGYSAMDDHNLKVEQLTLLTELIHSLHCINENVVACGQFLKKISEKPKEK
jgi:hypothetical protein